MRVEQVCRDEKTGQFVEKPEHGLEGVQWESVTHLDEDELILLQEYAVLKSPDSSPPQKASAIGGIFERTYGVYWRECHGPNAGCGNGGL